MFIVEDNEHDLKQNIPKALKLSETLRPEVKISDDVVFLNRENEDESYRMRKYMMYFSRLENHQILMFPNDLGLVDGSVRLLLSETDPCLSFAVYVTGPR